MKDERKTKKQLVAELTELRQRLSETSHKAAVSEEHTRAEERNRALYEFSPDGVVTVGLDSRIIECNQAYARMLGYGYEELEGFPFQDTMPHRWHDFCNKIHQEVMERGYSYEFEKECIRKDGSVFPASMRMWRIDDESGEPIGIWSIVRDITERKQREEEFRRYSERLEELVEDKTRTLRESGESFRSLAENAHDGILICMADQGKYVYANRRAAEITGYSVDELLKARIEDIAHPDELGRIIWGYRRRLAGKETQRQYETVINRKDGTSVSVELTAARTMWHGQPAVMAIVRDITERKLTEMTLRESEEKFRTLAEQSPNMIFINRKGQVVYANRRCEEVLGYDKEEFYAPDFSFLTLIAPKDQELIKTAFGSHMKGEEVEPYEYGLVTKDGRRIEVIITSKLIDYENERAILGIVTDITERKRAEEGQRKALAEALRTTHALRESEERYRSLFEGAEDHIFVVDRDFRYVTVNPSALKAGGFTLKDVVGKEPRELFPEDADFYISHYRRAFGTGKPVCFERGLRLPDGLHWFSVTLSPIKDTGGHVTALTGISRDITERKRAQERLTKINECFVSFGAAPSENINLLTALCGETLEATCALYNRLDGEMLCSLGQWNTPPDYNPVDKPEGHICYDVIQQGKDKVFVVRNLPETPYAQTDPNVIPYGLQTYVGWPVKFGDAYIGSLCVVYQNDFVPSEADEKFMEIIASAIGVEEERKRAEEALRTSDNAIASSITAIAIAEFAGNLTYVNAAFLRMWGYEDEDEALGKPAVEFWQTTEEAAQVIEALQNRGDWTGELVAKRKDGSLFDVQLSASIVTDETGKPAHMMASFVDITERKRAEEALELKITHLAAVSQASRTVTASLDLDQVLAEIVSLAGKVAASDYTTVILMGESGNLSRGAEDLPGVPALQYRIRPKGLTNWIVHQHQAAIIDEIKDGKMLPKPGKGAPRVANPHIVEAGVKSVAGLPLIAQDRLLGVLYLHSLVPGAFHDQLPLLTAFASQAAIALENARLYGAVQRELAERTQAEEELRQSARRLDTVHAIEEAILAAQSPEEIAQAVLSRIRQLVPCQLASVAVFDQKVCEATILAGTPTTSAKLEERTRIPLAPFGDIVETLQQGEAYLINDLLTYPHPPPVVQAQQAAGVRAYACVPLIVQGDLIGALSLSADTTGRFGEEQVEIARELANQLAIALQQARLHEQVQRHAKELERRVIERTRDLERRTVQLQAAAEVARDATTAHDLGELLDSAVGLIRERFGFYQAGIFLVDERGEYAVLRAATGEAGRQMLDAGHKLKVGEEGIVGYVTGSGKPRITLDVGADAVHFENPFLPGTRSELTLPLKVSDRVIGALDVQSIHEAAFDEDNVATLQIMADQLAVAIERTRLFEQTQATLEQRLRTVVANAPIVLFALDSKGVFTLSEGKGLETLGVKPGEHVGRSIFDVYHGMPQVLENMHRALAGESVAPVIKVGNALFESWYAPTRDESGKVTGVIGVATDITERKQAEEALRESEEKYRLVSENIPVAVYSALPDEYSTNLFLSGRMEELTGYPPEQFLKDPQLWTAVVHPDDREFVWEKIEEHRRNKCPLDVEYRIVTKDGTIKWVKDRATPMIDEKGEILRIDGFMEDITEHKHLEEQMRLQERLAAVGQLAGGIAHDFNNFLTTIMLYAQILMRKPSLSPELAPVAETILKESRRAAQLVRRLLDFSRRSLIETRPVDLASFIEETADILQRTLPENIQLLVDVGSDEYVVNADPARIQQVLMNLALNARDAMPDGGKLCIGLSRIEVKAGDEPPVAEMTCGEWVCLTISDTGTGMTQEAQSHLFEPFFTTKGPKGTGLGLAQVYGVVKRHDGHIGVETQAGQGTTFRVYLIPHEATEVPESQKPPSVLPQGQGEVILLAEDEDRVREAGCEILESLGYRVLIAANGQEALQVYRSAEGVELVLTDLVMPEMGGKELAQELKKIDPRVKVLAITGYALAEEVKELKQVGISNVVQKPFEVKTLAEVIRQTLDAD